MPQTTFENRRIFPLKPTQIPILRYLQGGGSEAMYLNPETFKWSFVDPKAPPPKINGQTINGLVQRRYLEETSRGYYTLTAKGKEPV